MPVASLGWTWGQWGQQGFLWQVALSTRKSQGSSLVNRKKGVLTLAAKASQCSIQKNSSRAGGAACAGRAIAGRERGGQQP